MILHEKSSFEEAERRWFSKSVYRDKLKEMIILEQTQRGFSVVFGNLSFKLLPSKPFLSSLAFFKKYYKFSLRKFFHSAVIFVIVVIFPPPA